MCPYRCDVAGTDCLPAQSKNLHSGEAIGLEPYSRPRSTSRLDLTYLVHPQRSLLLYILFPLSYFLFSLFSHHLPNGTVTQYDASP